MTRKTAFFGSLWVFAMLLSARMSSAQTVSIQPDIPRIISYQASLADAMGDPLPDGDYTIGMALYNKAGDRTLWRDTYHVHASRGVVNVLFGSGAVPLADLSAEGSLWLGIRINGGEELPLTEFTAAPYALTVPNGVITKDKIANGAVTTEKLGTDYVSSIFVNGQKLTGKGTPLNISTGDGLSAVFDPGSNNLLITTGADKGAHGEKGSKPLWVGETTAGNGDIDTPGSWNTVAGGQFNRAENGWASVTGGHKNTALGQYSVISGGDTNVISNIGDYSTIGGGQLNVETQAHTFIGGGLFNTIYAPRGTIGGGSNNSISNIGGTIGGGDSNSINIPAFAATEGFIGGGLGNTIANGSDGEPGPSVIGGGKYNTVWEGPSVIVGGEANTVGQEWAAIVAGQYNVDSVDHGFLGAGRYNKVLGGDMAYIARDTNIGGGASVVVGGSKNTTKANFNFIGGGYLNTTPENFATIAGGYGLTLGGFSFGFNGESATSTPHVTDLSISGAGFQHVAYFGGVDLLLGNVNDTARELRFYSPNHSLSYAGAKYSSFKAASQPLDIYYTLPDSLPLQGQFLKAATVSGSNITLKWATDIDTGSGGGLAGWLLAGNTGTTAGTNFIGTLDSQAFEIHVLNGATPSGGNGRVMRYAFRPLSPNILGGSRYNAIDSGLNGETIMGGGDSAMPNMIKQGITGGIKAAADFSSIGGGAGNVTWSEFDAIAGGRGNRMMFEVPFRSGFNFIGGGDSNFVGYGSYNNVIGGGYKNIVANAYGTVGGGYRNLLNGPGALNVIAGGRYNTVGGDISVNAYCERSTIGGGDSNMIREWASRSTVSGGYHNVIDSGVTDAFIGGGTRNSITLSPGSSLCGGDSNWISVVKTPCSVMYIDDFVGGGHYNSVEAADYGAVVGGINNHVYSHNSFIGGGVLNYTQGVSSVVVGGENSYTDGDYSSIGGGGHNTTYGAYSAIPGGEGLITNGYAQFVAGHFNAGSTSASKGTSHIGNDSILFMIGNGEDIFHTSNAIEVSDGGHISLHDTLGDMRSMRAGSGYVDNQIYAWALVDSFGRFVSGNGSPLFQKFGLEPITGHILGSGKYDFGLNTVDNNGDSVHFSGGSVLVTVVPLDPNGVCVIAYSTPLLTNGTFSVYLKNLNNSCLPVDERFTVQVVARPK